MGGGGGGLSFNGERESVSLYGSLGAVPLVSSRGRALDLPP